MIDIAATRQAYDQEVIEELVWIRRDYNISDSLTKIAVKEKIKTFMLTGEVEYTIEQFVVRNPKTK